MEIKGIDVSAHQGKINWDTVANYGMDFAILRITEVGNVIDSQFENNFAGCNKHKIPVGVYKYSYASTVSEAQSEARLRPSSRSPAVSQKGCFRTERKKDSVSSIPRLRES